MTYPAYDQGFSAAPPPRPQQQNGYGYGYGTNGYGPAPSWAPPTPPAPLPSPKRAVQLWLIGALVSLLVTLGIGLAFVLNEAPAPVAAPEVLPQGAPGNGGSEPGEDRPVPAPPADCLVECTQAPAPGGSDTEAHYSGSVDAAAAFVQDIADGNVAGAHDVLCGAGKSEFPTPEELLADFYTTLGIGEIRGATLIGVHAADDVSDAVVFELDTDVRTLTADVFIVEEASSLTVCGYDIAP